MIRFASLGSGSEGNCLIVEAGSTRVIADCGFTLKEAVARLARKGIEPSSINAVLVTHEHDDHIGGTARLARKFGIPVWLTYGTLQSARAQFEGVEVNLIDCGHKFAVGEIEIEPYTVPHDAREPAQFVFSDGRTRVGLLTDAGSLTPHMQRMLTGLDALVLECNHDLDMLMSGSYPERLKQRIAGSRGHLDNVTAARLLASIDCSRLQHLIAAHLSQTNNTAQLAGTALAAALNCELAWIGIATQHLGFDWRQVN